MNERTLISIHGYSGDAKQLDILRPVTEHHRAPIVVVSPEDAPITKFGPHHCRFAGKRAYVGQDSLDRQWLQMKLLLEEYPQFDFYFMNDADSFCITPELPRYLYDSPDVVFSNEVTDFRVPGATWTDHNGSYTWPADYHSGFPLIAMQPPYFMSHRSLERMVEAGRGVQACPTTPFIDWYMVQCVTLGGIAHHPFHHGASCETVTPNGIETMRNCVRKGATMLHAIKTQVAFDDIMLTYKQFCLK